MMTMLLSAPFCSIIEKRGDDDTIVFCSIIEKRGDDDTIAFCLRKGVMMTLLFSAREKG